MTVPTDDWFKAVKKGKDGKAIFPPIAQAPGPKTPPKNLGEAVARRLLPPS